MLQQVCQDCQKETEVSENKGYASYPSFEDFNKTLKQLEDEVILDFISSMHV